MGIGRNMLRVLPTDDNFCLDIAALEAALADDEEAGVRPACIIAAGGSTRLLRWRRCPKTHSL